MVPAVRNDWSAAPPSNGSAKLHAIIRFVAGCVVEPSSGSAALAFDPDAVEKWLSLGAFVRLAGRHLHRDRLAGPFAQHMDLGRETTSTLSDPLSFAAFLGRCALFFAPAAAL